MPYRYTSRCPGNAFAQQPTQHTRAYGNRVRCHTFLAMAWPYRYVTLPTVLALVCEHGMRMGVSACHFLNGSAQQNAKPDSCTRQQSVSQTPANTISTCNNHNMQQILHCMTHRHPLSIYMILVRIRIPAGYSSTVSVHRLPSVHWPHEHRLYGCMLTYPTPHAPTGSHLLFTNGCC